MSALSEALRALGEVLSAHAQGWLVFGAQAVAVHGVPRATQDLDVTVRVARADVPALLLALERSGFQPRYPELAAELARVGAVIPLVHAPTGFDVDLVLAGSGLEELALARARVYRVAGVDVPVIDAEVLVVMKVLAGRPLDLEDVRGLLARGAVDEREVTAILTELEAALGQSDLVPTFERLAAGR